MKNLHSLLLSEIQNQEEKFGTWDNPLYLGIQELSSIIVQPSRPSLPSSSSIALSKKKIFRKGAFSTSSPAPNNDNEELDDDGGRASLEGDKERSRLLARTRVFCKQQQISFMFYIV